MPNVTAVSYPLVVPNVTAVSYPLVLPNVTAVSCPLVEYTGVKDSNTSVAM